MNCILVTVVAEWVYFKASNSDIPGNTFQCMQVDWTDSKLCFLSTDVYRQASFEGFRLPHPARVPLQAALPCASTVSARAGAAFGGHSESLSQGFGVQGRRERILVLTFRGPFRLYRISGFLPGKKREGGKVTRGCLRSQDPSLTF